ncbi:unnamed protein product, partial [Polarella glacialis]
YGKLEEVSPAAFCSGLTDSPVYLGGQSATGLVILTRHAGMDGSQQLRPGIFSVPPQVALDARMLSKKQALDFRIHLGRTCWGPGELLSEVQEGMWRTVAASAPLALKHCLMLPKPLWSEILELCGGEASELSAFARSSWSSASE